MQIDLKNVQFFIDDGSGSPNTIEVIIGEGNLTFQEFNEMQYMLNRGLLAAVRKGDQKPIEVSMDFRWDTLKSNSGATAPTIKEALTQTGLASTWVSTGTDPCEPYAVNIRLVNTPCAGISGAGTEAEIETITLQYFRPESFNHDPKAGSVSCTGKCNIISALVTHS